MLAIVIITISSFIYGACIIFLLIPILKKRQFKQYIREDGPSSHLSKEGTPTMGGIGIIASILVVSIIASGVMEKRISSDIVIMIYVTLLFGGIGFFDDFLKIIGKQNLGLRAWQKLALQFVFAGIMAVYMTFFSPHGTRVWIPFWGEYLDFSYLYIPFVIFVVVAMANSVNLTDGLDGLSSGVTAIVCLFFAVIANYLSSNPALIYCSVIAGACMGFRLFNRYPAKVFMGDTGSMALGGAVASVAILMKLEFLLVIIGFVYVMEALSVIIQVLYFKKTGKRFFKMAPIHHHFELSGYKEYQVVNMFCIFTVVLGAIGLIIFLK